MKILAIDYGQARTGIAVTDAGGRMAFPRAVLRKNTRDAFLAELCALIIAEDPATVVIGLPLHNDGSESLSTRQTRNFAQALKRRLATVMNIAFYYMEELLSTYQAEEDLRAAGRRRLNDGDLDRQAAVRILESFLNETATRRKPV